MGHHYVPRFYLKNFAFNEDKTLVYSMTKEGEIPCKPSPIRNICAKKNYNTPQQEREQNELEDQYAVVLSNIINSANKGKIDYSDELIKFISFLMANNENTRRIFIESFRDMIGKNMSQDIRIDGEDRKKFDLSYVLSKRFYDLLKTWYFIRVIENNNKKIFITSDNPVSVINTSDVSLPVTGGLNGKFEEIKNDKNYISMKMSMTNVFFNEKVALIFPINPSLGLIGFSDHESCNRFLKNPGEHLAQSINVTTFSQCNRAVYSHSTEILEQTKADSNFL